ncbi:UvrD-helicase domain-containing protein [soil metagenome]
MPQSDTAARCRALDPARSFIVQAPAGSGKTELLTQRYLRLLGIVERPEEVVALTFTVKAAGEMRARVLAALERARSEVPPRERHLETTWRLGRAALEQNRRHRWRLLDQPARLRILTIDALNAMIGRQMPYLSGAGSDRAIAADPRPLYAQAARRALARVDAPPDEAAPVICLLQQLDNRFAEAERLLGELLAGRDRWLRLISGRVELARERLEAVLANLVRERLAALRAAVPRELAAEIIELAAAAGARVANEHAPIAACRDLRELPGEAPEDVSLWCGLASFLLTDNGQWRRTVNVKQGFPPARRGDKQRALTLLPALATREELRERLAACRKLPPPRYSDAQWSVLSALISVLPIAAAELELVFDERGETDFIAQAQAALRALGNDLAPSDLALALDYRIRHLLVDEFQDTSRTQFELLERLTAGWEPGDGRTLFLVGDPTQSIYGFRDAVVGLFVAAKRWGIGDVQLEPLSLSANFRSQQGLVTWVNDVFAAVLPATEELASGAVAYVPGEASLPALDGDAVTVHPSVGDSRAEAETVVRVIETAQREDPEQTISVLVRSRSHLADIAARLTSNGIRYQAVEIARLGYRPAIRDLVALTSALLHLADRTAWLAVLRAPWCGLSLADLHTLAAPAPAATLWSCLEERARDLSADGVVRARRLRHVLSKHLARRGRARLRDWVEQAWIALGGPATLEEPADLANAQAYFALLDTLSRTGELPDVAQLEAGVDELYAAPDPGADERLQLMTIHKAKGLEFDTVILPGLDRSPRREEKQLLEWIELMRETGPPDLLIAPIGFRGDTDPLHDYIGRLRQQRDRLESERLLYVAATRARRRLHLLGRAGVFQAEDGPAPRPPRSDTFLHTLWPALLPSFAQAAREAAPAARHEPEPLRPTGIRRLPAGWSPPAAATPVPFDERLASPTAELVPPVYAWAGEPARRIGTVVHRALQRIAEAGAEAWTAARVEALRPVVRSRLRVEGLAAPAIDEATTRVLEALRRTLDDERGRWILGGARRDARCEHAVSGIHAGKVVNAVIDRTFVDEAGARWIVDYKSSRHEGGTLDEFLANELVRYAPKLELYASLLRRLYGQPVRAGLYFPLYAQWREWTSTG